MGHPASANKLLTSQRGPSKVRRIFLLFFESLPIFLSGCFFLSFLSWRSAQLHDAHTREAYTRARDKDQILLLHSHSQQSTSHSVTFPAELLERGFTKPVPPGLKFFFWESTSNFRCLFHAKSFIKKKQENGQQRRRGLTASPGAGLGG